MDQVGLEFPSLQDTGDAANANPKEDNGVTLPAPSSITPTDAGDVGSKLNGNVANNVNWDSAPMKIEDLVQFEDGVPNYRLPPAAPLPTFLVDACFAEGSSLEVDDDMIGIPQESFTKLPETMARGYEEVEVQPLKGGATEEERIAEVDGAPLLDAQSAQPLDEVSQTHSVVPLHKAPLMYSPIDNVGSPMYSVSPVDEIQQMHSLVSADNQVRRTTVEDKVLQTHSVAPVDYHETTTHSGASFDDEVRQMHPVALVDIQTTPTHSLEMPVNQTPGTKLGSLPNVSEIEPSESVNPEKDSQNEGETFIQTFNYISKDEFQGQEQQKSSLNPLVPSSLTESVPESAPLSVFDSLPDSVPANNDQDAPPMKEGMPEEETNPTMVRMPKTSPVESPFGETSHLIDFNPGVKTIGEPNIESHFETAPFLTPSTKTERETAGGESIDPFALTTKSEPATFPTEVGVIEAQAPNAASIVFTESTEFVPAKEPAERRVPTNETYDKIASAPDCEVAVSVPTQKPLVAPLLITELVDDDEFDEPDSLDNYAIDAYVADKVGAPYASFGQLEKEFRKKETTAKAVESKTDMSNPAFPQSSPRSSPVENVDLFGFLSGAPPSVTDLIYWREPMRSGVAMGVTLVLLISFANFSVVSVIAHAALFSLLASFIYVGVQRLLGLVGSGGTAAGHPFATALAISPEDLFPGGATHARSFAIDAVGVFFDAASHLRRWFFVADVVDSLKFGAGLYLVACVGDSFNLMTLVVVGVVAVFSLPVLYRANRAQIDAGVDGVTSAVLAQWPLVRAALFERASELWRKVAARVPGSVAQ